MDFEVPSFSLGLDSQVPSFSLGLDDLFPATPSVGVEGNVDGGGEGVAVSSSCVDARDDFGEDAREASPVRCLKRLRRGRAKSVCDERSSSQPSVGEQCGVDEIEEFSEEEHPSRIQSQSQSYKPRAFTALKPVKTPPVFESMRVTNEQLPPLAPHSRVTSKKTSLGSKEVKFQEIPNTYVSPPPSFDYNWSTGRNTSSGTEKARTPLYEFRDNRICIDLDEDDQEPSSSCPSTATETAQLIRERFPFFSFVDDLEQGKGGEPVYIDYRGQFGRNSEVRSNSAVPAEPQRQAKTKPVKKRKARNTDMQVLQDNSSTGAAGKKGHWLTCGGSKVYVTAEGQRLTGRAAYKRHLKDNGNFSKHRKGKGRNKPNRKRN